MCDIEDDESQEGAVNTKMTHLNSQSLNFSEHFKRTRELTNTEKSKLFNKKFTFRPNGSPEFEDTRKCKRCKACKEFMEDTVSPKKRLMSST